MAFARFDHQLAFAHQDPERESARGYGVNFVEAECCQGSEARAEALAAELRWSISVGRAARPLFGRRYGVRPSDF
jgi:hypothetical protein